MQHQTNSAPNLRLGSFVDVDFPKINKNDDLCENDDQIAAGAHRTFCRIDKVVTLDPNAFRRISRSLLQGRSHVWCDIGGSSSDAPELQDVSYVQIMNDERLLAIYRETACTHVVLVQCTDSTRRPFFVNTEGYDYARYVGRLSA